MSRPGIRKILIISAAVIFIALVSTSAFWIIGASAENSKQSSLEVGPVFETEEYTVNIANTLNHFIKAKFAIELNSEEALEEVAKKLPIIQDAIIMVLSGQELQNLNTVEGKEELKKTVLKAINDILEDGEAIKIYYRNIIFQ